MTRPVLEILGAGLTSRSRAPRVLRARGAGPYRAWVAWPPILTISGCSWPPGAVFTELFGWPGRGRQRVSSVLARDVQAVQGAALFIALSFVMVNLVVDLLNLYLDPRSRPA